MKKLLTAIIAAVLCFSLSVVTVSGAGDEATVERTVRALGIMTGDSEGNMNLTANVTRAEFAKMMTAASAYKDSVGEGAGYSMFKDVKSTHWASEYIKLAVENGWFVGYVDGTFRPDNTITLEEAASALLRLLGYTSDDLKGSFPQAQLSKFNALGLGENVGKTRGQTLTRRDCMTIFYNLMTVNTKDGKVYAATLGYTVDAAGELDYQALVRSGMKGPFVLESSSGLSRLLPFSGGNIAVYKNGRSSGITSASVYDVVYYNSNIRSVWLYSTKVTGVLTEISPSSASPESVTVAGAKYTFETSAAAYKVSSMGEYTIGDTVTLLIGMDGAVADVISAGLTSDIVYGIVLESGKRSYTDVDGKIKTTYMVKLICTDGVARDYDTSGSFLKGSIVAVEYSGTQSGVRVVGTKTVSGDVNKDATKLGDLRFSDDVQILDINSELEYVRIPVSRIAGVSFKASDTRFYALDENGDISHLVLNNATGDLSVYGIVTSVLEEGANSMNMSAKYGYIIDGVAGTYSVTSKHYGTRIGGALFSYTNGTISNIENLTSVKLDSLGETSATSGVRRFALSDAMQVYVRSGGGYDLVNAETVRSTGAYTLTAYYDDLGLAAGGRIRLIVAEAK